MRRIQAATAVLGCLLAGGGAFFLDDSGGSQPGQDGSCALSESTFTAETLRDLRSFADAMAIVEAVGEEIPPQPDGPEGWAGVIGRVVTVRIERVLWRRPHAPPPPAMFRFSDWGWFGTLEDREPARACGATRMALGRRYLAPIARLRDGGWYPFQEARLRLNGTRVVGGVDGGEPNIAHNALAGRSIAGAVRLVARTRPYRAVVRHPRLDPARRWQAVHRDGYRVWRGRPGEPFPIRSGVTARARWELYLRLPRRGGMCVGIQARPLWRGFPSPSGEGCGPRRIARDAITIGSFSVPNRGHFVFGRAGELVAEVVVRLGGRRPRALPTYPTPIPPGGRGRFWVLPAAPGACLPPSVQGLDADGQVLSEVSYRGC